jgi:DNA-binding NtrC family response regulator
MQAADVRLLIAEDDASLRSVLSRELARRGYRVRTAEDGLVAASILERQEIDVALLDVRMPGLDGLRLLALARALEPPPEVVMLTGNSTIEVAVEAMKMGACDFLTKPCPLDAVDQILRKAAERRWMRSDNVAMKRRLLRDAGTTFIFRSEAMARVSEMIARIGPSDGTVLITGESGTGKELAAHGIHDASPRVEAPFVDVNCGAIPESLLESELFGHEKGAFTGADATRPGLYEMAHRGTLFLDEIGDLPRGLQVKPLPVLESKSFYRVGGRRRIEADVRVIAATNRSLAADVESGAFRNDLYFRINGLEIRIPPLRERPEDVPVLAAHFAAPKTVPPATLARLSGYSWPGNVRELRNVMERAKLIGKRSSIEIEDLPPEITREPNAREADGRAPAESVPAAPPTAARTSARLDDLERRQILAILDQVRWNRGRAAELLGISAKTLYRKLRSYGI